MRDQRSARRTRPASISPRGATAGGSAGQERRRPSVGAVRRMHYMWSVTRLAAGPASWTGPPPPLARARPASWLPYVLLAALTLVAYASVRHYGFVNFDDPGYVAANPHVARGLDAQGVVWAFTTGRTANWIPVTWLSYQLDVSLFGVSPAAHHVVNVLLHVANVLLLLAVLRRLGCSPEFGFVVAGLFALHPMRVESVAWISERKDVLCAFFGLWSTYVWIGWARSGGVARYAAALLLYAIGLMAKPMLVTLPFVLLLLDWFPLRRLRWSPPSTELVTATPLARLLTEKVPLFALAIGSSVVTLLVQKAGGAVADPLVLPLAARLRGALAAYGWYIVKSLWPDGLAALYPNPALTGGSPPVYETVAGAVALVLVSALALREAGCRPWLLVGWATFVGMLVPVVGLVQVGQQSTADRYTYLPSIGLYVVLVGVAGAVADRWRVAPGLRVALALSVLLALGIATHQQLRYWCDGVTLARRALSVTEGNYVMRFNLAHALDEQGDLPGALASYAEAVRLRPDLVAFRVNHGAALARSGRVVEACAEYETAIRLDPRDRGARNNLAWLRATHPEARFRDAVRALALAGALAAERPGDPDTLDLLAAALAESGRFGDAQRTADVAALAAQRAGHSDRAAQIAARRALYAAGRAYREDPATGAPAPAS